MKNIISKARNVSLNLRVEEYKRVNEKYSTCETNIHHMAKDAADAIDTLTAALMISGKTIEELGKMLSMTNEQIQTIFNIIDETECIPEEVDKRRINNNEK